MCLKNQTKIRILEHAAVIVTFAGEAWVANKLFVNTDLYGCEASIVV